MDCFTRGFIAGLAGGILMNTWNFFSYYILKLTTLRYADWMGEILYGHLPRTPGEVWYALFIQLLWTSFLSIIFTYLVPFTSSRSYLLKAIVYGLIAGLLNYSIPRIYKMPDLLDIPLQTVISNHFGGLIWSVTMVLVLVYLDALPRSDLQKNKS